ALLGQGQSQLADGGGLAGAVDPDDQDNPGALVLLEQVEGQRAVAGADGVEELGPEQLAQGGPAGPLWPGPGPQALEQLGGGGHGHAPRSRPTSRVELATPPSAASSASSSSSQASSSSAPLVSSPDMPRERAARERPRRSRKRRRGAMISSAGGAAVATPRSGRSTSARSRLGRGGWPGSSPTPGSRSSTVWPPPGPGRSASWRRRRPATRGTTASRLTITRVGATTRTRPSPSTTPPRCGGEDADVVVNGARGA